MALGLKSNQRRRWCRATETQRREVGAAEQADGQAGGRIKSGRAGRGRRRATGGWLEARLRYSGGCFDLSLDLDAPLRRRLRLRVDPCTAAATAGPGGAAEQFDVSLKTKAQRAATPFSPSSSSSRN